MTIVFRTALDRQGSGWRWRRLSTGCGVCELGSGVVASQEAGDGIVRGVVSRSVRAAVVWLEVMYLNDNQLSGEIPPELSNLTNLEVLALGGNLLSGCVPRVLRLRLNMEFPDLGDIPFC